MTQRRRWPTAALRHNCDVARDRAPPHSAGGDDGRGSSADAGRGDRAAAPNPEAFQFPSLKCRWAHLDAPRHLFLVRSTRWLGSAETSAWRWRCRPPATRARCTGTRSAGARLLQAFAGGAMWRSGMRVIGSALTAPYCGRSSAGGHQGSTYTLTSPPDSASTGRAPVSCSGRLGGPALEDVADLGRDSLAHGKRGDIRRRRRRRRGERMHVADE